MFFSETVKCGIKNTCRQQRSFYRICRLASVEHMLDSAQEMLEMAKRWAVLREERDDERFFVTSDRSGAGELMGEAGVDCDCRFCAIAVFDEVEHGVLAHHGWAWNFSCIRRRRSFDERVEQGSRPAAFFFGLPDAVALDCLY